MVSHMRKKTRSAADTPRSVRSVHCRSLRKRFKIPGGGRLDVLNGIDLTVRAGEFVTLMGPSGSGKSTLLNIIGGLIPSTGGTVVVNGRSLTTMDHHALTEVRRRDVGWIFQDFNLIAQLTALENVMIPMNLAGVPDDDARARAMTLLTEVGLAERMDHFPDTLSGGQQQRAATARALANDPPLVLADEPTGNLDTVTGLEIIAFFQQLVERGKSVLMVTHDTNLAMASDRVYILRGGRLVQSIGDQKSAGHPTEATV